MYYANEESRYNSVSLDMSISGAKFEEHCSNLSGDILDSVSYYLGGRIYDIITFLICIIKKHMNISKTENYISKRKMPFFFSLKRPSNKPQLFFLLQ